MQRIAGIICWQTNQRISHLPIWPVWEGSDCGVKVTFMHFTTKLDRCRCDVDDTPEIGDLVWGLIDSSWSTHMTMESLLKDGPSSGRIRKAGWRAPSGSTTIIKWIPVRQPMKLPNTPWNLMKIMGRCNSYFLWFKSILRVSHIEVASLVARLGENATLARRARFLHSLSETVDAVKWKEVRRIGALNWHEYTGYPVVVNTIASHHDVEPVSSQSLSYSGSLSAARPGAERWGHLKATSSTQDLEKKLPVIVLRRVKKFKRISCSSGAWKSGVLWLAQGQSKGW